MDDTFRREWAVQIAHERAAQARARTRPFVEQAAEAAEQVEHGSIERSRWLGLQVRSLLALVAVAEEELRAGGTAPRLLALDHQSPDRPARARRRHVARRARAAAPGRSP